MSNTRSASEELAFRLLSFVGVGLPEGGEMLEEMLLDQASQLECHECGSPAIEPRGCVFAVDPHPRPDPRLGTHRVTRVVEHKYRCERCGYEFSTVEEF